MIARPEHAKSPRGSRATLAGMLSALLFLTAGLLQGAESIPPKPEKYFNDFAKVVSPEVARQLNDQLAQFERDTSNQILVAAFPKLPQDAVIEDFAQGAFHAWGVGQKDKRNGAVLFVFVQDHKMRIQTGYGLEGALPDVTCSDIIDHVIAPRFKAGDYNGGFAAGVNAMLAAAKGEYKGSGSTVRERERPASSGGGSSGLGFLPILIFLVLAVVLSRMARRSRNYSYTSSGGNFIGGFVAGSLLGGGSSSGGGWSGGGSSSSFGGGGDSGFSGGGGDSGGGGASGSW